MMVGVHTRQTRFMLITDLQPRLHLAPLPTCSPWMNDIERDFSHIQHDVLDNSNFGSARECMKIISDYFEKELNSNKQRI